MFILATGLESGATVKECAEAAGITERYAYLFMGRNTVAFKEVRARIGPLVNTNIREIRKVAKENAEEEFAQRLGAAFDALDESLTDPRQRVEAFKEVFDRNLGKAASTIHVSGNVGHQHTFTIEEQRAFALDAQEDYSLHSKANLLTSGTPVLSIKDAEMVDAAD